MVLYQKKIEYIAKLYSTSLCAKMEVIRAVLQAWLSLEPFFASLQMCFFLVSTIYTIHLLICFNLLLGLGWGVLRRCGKLPFWHDQSFLAMSCYQPFLGYFTPWIVLEPWYNATHVLITTLFKRAPTKIMLRKKASSYFILLLKKILKTSLFKTENNT